jgi:hypothetical protein
MKFTQGKWMDKWETAGPKDLGSKSFMKSMPHSKKSSSKKSKGVGRKSIGKSKTSTTSLKQPSGRK